MDAVTELSLLGLLRKWTSGVPYPLLFIAGAGVGVLLASIIVVFSHAMPRQRVALSAPAKVASAAWTPPLVMIVPPPLEPADANMIRVPVIPDQIQGVPPPVKAKKLVVRGQSRRVASRPAKPGRDLLAAAL